MTELGIHGFGERPDGVDWFSNVRWALDQSPAFSSVWISDHLQYQGTPEPEAWTWLAASFPDLRVGTMVLSQSYRNPGLLGTMARTLQDLTHGRLVLGLGAGWLEEEYRAFRRSRSSRCRPEHGSPSTGRPTLPPRAATRR